MSTVHTAVQPLVAHLRANGSVSQNFRCAWGLAGCGFRTPEEDAMKAHIDGHVGRAKDGVITTTCLWNHGRLDACSYSTILDAQGQPRPHKRDKLISHLASHWLLHRELCVCGHQGLRLKDMCKKNGHWERCAVLAASGASGTNLKAVIQVGVGMDELRAAMAEWQHDAEKNLLQPPVVECGWPGEMAAIKKAVYAKVYGDELDFDVL